MRIIGIAALLAALFAASAHAQVYQWRDAHGQVHYGDQAPPGSGATLLRPGNPPPPAAAETEAPTQPATVEPTPAEAQPPRPSAAEARQQAAAERQRQEELKQNCQAARNQLAALESGQRIARFSETGEREFLDDAQRAEETARSRKLIQEFCSN